MLKPIQLVCKICLALTIFIVIATILIIIFVDPNTYKAEICTMVHKYTGRELTIDGKIKWSLTPQITLGVQNITLNNPQGFAGPFLKAKEASIKLSLMELLKRKIVITGLTLQSPALFLINGINGQNNFANFSTTTPTKNANMEKNLPSPQKTQPSSPPININILDIQNGIIQWQDLTTNKTLQIYNLNVAAKNLTIGSKSPLSPLTISGQIKELNSDLKEITFQATVIADITHKSFQFDPLQVQMAKINASGNATVKLMNNTLKITPINIELLGSKHQASMIINSKEKIPTITFEDQTNTFAIDPFLTELLQYKKIHGNGNFNLAVKVLGKNLHDIKHSLQGKVELTIQKGSIDGLDIHKLLKQAEETLHSLFNAIKQNPEANIPSLFVSLIRDWHTNQTPNAKTNFEELKANASFQNGISNDCNFTIKNADYDVNGHGQINLTNETINLEIKALYKSLAQNPNTEVAKYMLNSPLTIMVQGNLYNPTIKFDLREYCKGAINNIQKELIKHTIKKTLQKILPGDNGSSNDQLKDPRKIILDNLFKNKE